MHLRYNVATSLDNFLAPLVHDSSIDLSTLYAGFDAFVMGRKTYQTITADPGFSPSKGRTKQSVVVISRSLDEGGDYPGITILGNWYIEHIRDMKQQNGNCI